MSSFYITTAIDYANGDPHHGHAFEKIGADVIARYRRMRGDDVHFLIGMDEHGQKVAQAAAERGMEPQKFVDDVAARFIQMWARFDISYDQFIRTTDEAHRKGVRALIKRIYENNPDDFYEKSYKGWYCVGCELFKRDDEIVAGRCVEHPTRELQWTEERNWFFRLTKYSDFLKRLFDERRDFLQPDSRRNEIRSLLDQGLEDISISRARLAWAIPFPLQSADPGASDHGTWVWFDALPNYLTATGYPRAVYRERWPAQLHVVGKDITRLHAVVWPAMLQAAELPLPERIWAHGFVLLGGERFSKSSGVRLDLNEAIDRYGSDALRYYLLREVPFDGDGSFSWERFEERYNSELANALGNLASRTIAMIDKYCDGVVPAGRPNDVDALDAADYQSYHSVMSGARGYLLHEALKNVWATVSRGNEYVDSQAPWRLARDPERSQDLAAVLASLVRQLGRHAVHLAPFMPRKSQELWSSLGAPGDVSQVTFEDAAAIVPTGWNVVRGAALFPRDDLGASRAGG